MGAYLTPSCIQVYVSVCASHYGEVKEWQQVYLCHHHHDQTNIALSPWNSK